MSDPATILTGAQAAADISPYINGIVGTIVSAGVTACRAFGTGFTFVAMISSLRGCLPEPLQAAEIPSRLPTVARAKKVAGSLRPRLIRRSRG